MKVIFDTKSLYYLPQYIPVHKELLKRGAETVFVFYHGLHDAIIKEIIATEGIFSKWVENETEAVDFYEKEAANWVFFANTL